MEIVKSQASSCCIASVSTSVNLRPHSQQDDSKDMTAKKYGTQTPSIPPPQSWSFHSDPAFSATVLFPELRDHCCGTP